MKKDKQFILTGLVASILLVINYVLMAALLMSDSVNSTVLMITRLASPVLLIIVLLSLRHVLVGMAGMKNFNLVISLFLVVQLFIFLILLKSRPDTASGGFLGAFAIILGLLNLGLFIWFSVALLKIKPESLTGHIYLKAFVITALAIMLTSLILSLAGVENKAVTGLLAGNSSGIQYIFMAAFFWTRFNI